MQVILVRHGITAANLKRLYNGRTDDPLCDQGVQHAHASGADLTVERLYVSPMKRAVQTAMIKFPNAERIVCDDLREMDFGDFEGRGYEDLKQDSTYQNWVDSGGTLQCPNGEKMSDFSQRICLAFDGIVRQASSEGEKRLVIVAHGGSLMAILGQYGRPERPYYEWYVENCCGYRAEIIESNWTDIPALTACEMFEKL